MHRRNTLESSHARQSSEVISPLKNKRHALGSPIPKLSTQKSKDSARRASVDIRGFVTKIEI